jgi:hypothetical protein
VQEVTPVHDTPVRADIVEEVSETMVHETPFHSKIRAEVLDGVITKPAAIQKEVVTQETPPRSTSVAEGIVGSVMEDQVEPFHICA